MKHITVQSFTCASVDQANPAMSAIKGNASVADRKLDKTM